MRIVYENDDIIIEAPEAYHFSRDRYFYSFTGLIDKAISAEVAIDGVRYIANSFSNSTKIDITDVLRDKVGSINVAIKYNIGGNVNNVAETIKVSYGATISLHTHGAADVIEINDYTKKVEFFALGYGRYSVDEGGFKPINAIGIYDGTPSAVTKFIPSYDINIKYQYPYKIGDIRNLKLTNTHKIRVVNKPICSDSVIVYYNDLDGIRRSAIGKIIDSNTIGEYTNYNSNTIGDSYTPSRYVNEVSNSINIGFYNIPIGQNLIDIMYSSQVMLNNSKNEVICAIAPITKNMVESGDIADYIINFTIDKV